MAEPLPEPLTSPSAVDPVELERALARKNAIWGWSLFALFLVLFGGSVLVAYVYNWLS